MFTVKYYDHSRTVDSPEAALAACREMLDTYGRAGKPPVIHCETEISETAMRKAMAEAREDYPIR